MDFLAQCQALSDHPQGFAAFYEAILATAKRVPSTALFCEIGTRQGGSALLALEAIKESGVDRVLLTVDPYGGKPYHNRDVVYHNFHDDHVYRKMMRDLSTFCDEHHLNHAHYKMTSAEFMETFGLLRLWHNQQTLDPIFGFVYLDGEHHPVTVTQELDWFLPKLADGGLLVIDDVENLDQTDSPVIGEVLRKSEIKGNRAFYRKAPQYRDTPLVLTLAIGDDYQALARITHPTIEAYAKKIGAYFLVITERKISQTTPHWEKGQIYDLLNEYRRILYVDTDILIRDDCPNVFALVPESMLGMFNEAPFCDRSRELMIEICKAYEKTLPHWSGKYFNSGLMVISQAHKQVFKKPEKEVFSFYEQSFLNVQIASLNIPMFELPYHFNRMTCVDAYTGESRLASYIVHYAGAPTIQTVIDLARQDLETWRAMRGHYHFQRHIHVIVSGGLGDQVQAEPAIRFMKKHVYPDAHITVTTHWPRLFAHLDVEVCRHEDFRPRVDTPYYTVQSLPPPESVTWMVLSNLLCHTVDYCSAALLRRTLPMADKRVHLTSGPEDLAALRGVTGDTDLEALVVVHAGRHWNTKTFPVDWWQAVVDGLADVGARVCLIGQDDETRGVLPVHGPQDGLDLRNRLTLAMLIALLKQAPVLVSNDSAPIHLAGAFDQQIILLPSCKHPDHVLPWRHGSVFWRATALYKRLTLDDVSARPTDVHGSSAEFQVDDWSRYLPEVDAVVEAVLGYVPVRMLVGGAHGQ